MAASSSQTSRDIAPLRPCLPQLRIRKRKNSTSSPTPPITTAPWLPDYSPTPDRPSSAAVLACSIYVFTCFTISSWLEFSCAPRDALQVCIRRTQQIIGFLQLGRGLLLRYAGSISGSPVRWCCRRALLALVALLHPWGRPSLRLGPFSLAELSSFWWSAFLPEFRLRSKEKFFPVRAWSNLVRVFDPCGCSWACVPGLAPNLARPAPIRDTPPPCWPETYIDSSSSFSTALEF